MRALYLCNCGKVGTDAAINVGFGNGIVSLEFEEVLPTFGTNEPIRDGVQILLSVKQFEELQRKIGELKLEAVPNGKRSAGSKTKV